MNRNISAYPARKLEELESDCGEKFRIVFKALDALPAPLEKRAARSDSMSAKSRACTK